MQTSSCRQQQNNIVVAAGHAKIMRREFRRFELAEVLAFVLNYSKHNRCIVAIDAYLF